MSNELEIKLQNILNDKNENLLPENLKEGVTCLGVQGTLSPGSTINNQNITINKNGVYNYDYGYTGLNNVLVDIPTGDTKTFTSIQEMNEDSNPIPEGKAIIYTNDKVYIGENNNFTTAYFPELITLPEAVTTNIEATLHSKRESRRR